MSAQHTPKPDDAIQAALVKAIERKGKAALWTPADAITFTPRVLPTVFGDGRALFTLATINQRPAYWVIRACSTWSSGYECGAAIGSDFGDHTDEILTALEEAFGNGRCGYSGCNLFFPKRERIKYCKCEECSDGSFRARWPMVDGDGGCSWSRMDWPNGFEVEPNPLSWKGNLLRAAIAKATGSAA